VPGAGSVAAPVAARVSGARPESVLGADADADARAGAGQDAVVGVRAARGRVAVPEDLQVCPAHRGSRLDAEFVEQAGPQVAVDGEGLGLAAVAVQDEHQKPVERLAERMLRRTRGQLRCQPVEPGGRRSKAQLRLVPPFEDQQPGLLQALDEGVTARLGRQAAQRGATPQRERGGGLAQRPLPVALGVRVAREGRVPLEDADVELVLADPQDVSRRYRAQPFRVVEETAQPGHMVLQGRLGGGGWCPAPQGVLEYVDGDDPARFEEQRRQQGAHLAAADRADLAVRVVQDRRPQQPEPQPVPHHAAPLPFRPARPAAHHGGFPPSRGEFTPID
jgi:hypothetical protein